MHAIHADHQHAADPANAHHHIVDIAALGGSISPPGPHGGQVTVAGRFRFEVVYQPRESRIYLYDDQFRPIRAKGVEGRAIIWFHRATTRVRGHRLRKSMEITPVMRDMGTQRDTTTRRERTIRTPVTRIMPIHPHRDIPIRAARMIRIHPRRLNPIRPDAGIAVSTQAAIEAFAGHRSSCERGLDRKFAQIASIGRSLALQSRAFSLDCSALESQATIKAASASQAWPT